MKDLRSGPGSVSPKGIRVGIKIKLKIGVGRNSMEPLMFPSQPPTAAIHSPPPQIQLPLFLLLSTRLLSLSPAWQTSASSLLPFSGAHPGIHFSWLRRFLADLLYRIIRPKKMVVTAMVLRCWGRKTKPKVNNESEKYQQQVKNHKIKLTLNSSSLNQFRLRSETIPDISSSGMAARDWKHSVFN